MSPLKRYTDAEFGFSISIPSGCLTDTTGPQGTRLIVHFPGDSYGFRANVNVMVQQLGAMSPEEYVILSRFQIKQISGRAGMDVDQPLCLHQNGHLFEWHAPFGPSELRVRQLVAIRMPTAFVVAATALEDAFKSYEQAFQTMLESFAVDPVRSKHSARDESKL